MCRGIVLTAVALAALSACSSTGDADSSGSPEPGGSEATSGGAAEWEFHLVEPEGWEYDVVIRVPELEHEVDVSRSPPGKAVVRTRIPIGGEYEAIDTLEGRFAPSVRSILLHYELELPETPPPNLDRKIGYSGCQLWDHNSGPIWRCNFFIDRTKAYFLDGSGEDVETTRFSVTDEVTEDDARWLVESVASAEPVLVAWISIDTVDDDTSDTRCIVELLPGGEVVPQGDCSVVPIGS